jgi:hypothetical protein
MSTSGSEGRMSAVWHGMGKKGVGTRQRRFTRRDGDVGAGESRVADKAVSIFLSRPTSCNGRDIYIDAASCLVFILLFLPQPSRIHAASMMAKQHAHLMGLVGKMIPPLSPKLHKGQAGEWHVIPYRDLAQLVRKDRGAGRLWRVSKPAHGCVSNLTNSILSYSGAPYFSSMGAMRFGADLAHVICQPDAGAVIKT